MGNKRIEIYAKLDAEDQILGIAVLGLVSNRMSIICMARKALSLNKFQIESIQRELFESGYKRFKTTGQWVLANAALEGSLREYAIELGFRGFERASMEITRNILENIDDSKLIRGFSILPFDVSMKETLGRLIFRGNVGSVDVDVFPMFFSTEKHE